MHAHQALRSVVLVVILMVGSILPALVSTPVAAQSTQGNTTLYFTNYMNFLTSENSSDTNDFGFASLSVNPPTNPHDAQYPPNIFVKNTNFPLFKPKQWTSWFTNATGQWFIWVTTAWLLQGFNLSDLSNYFGNGTFSGFDFTLFLPTPTRVVESYTYNGESTVAIQGNLTYNLYFSPPEGLGKLPKFEDNVTVGLYTINTNSLIPLPKFVANTSVRLTPKLLSGIYNQPVTLEKVSLNLNPGDSLLFSVEINPKDKPKLIFDFTQRPDIKKITAFVLNRWETNKTHGPIRKLLGALIENITTAADALGINITQDIIATFLDVYKSSQFIYDSLYHPSSVTVPAKISVEDFQVYYLHADKTMDDTQPTGTKGNSLTLSNKNEIIWNVSEPLDRNKLLVVGNTTLEVYLQKLLFLIRPFNLQLKATLYDNGVAIASVQKKVTLKEIKPILGRPKRPIILTFNDSAIEMSYGHQLGVGLSISKSYLLKPKLLVDSATYPSSLRVRYEETNNIQVRDVTVTPANAMIVPGGSVRYLLNISSKKADNITISTIDREKNGGWEVTAPSTASVKDNGIVSIPVFINSTDTLKTAYDSMINTTLVITGHTGITRTSASADVTRDAIRYDLILMDYEHNITMNKGETKDFYFIIKNNNTGAIDDIDNYTVAATSENGWRVIPRESIHNVRRGETSLTDDARVVIEVPANTTLESDVVTITVTSDSDPSTSASIMVTVNLQPPDIFESIYESFNSVAKSLGLADIFGENAGVALAGLLTIIILFIIIILAFVVTLKDVDIICTQRINEIEPDQQAIFELALRNPTRKPQSYDLTTQHTGEPSQWTVTVDPATIQIEGRQKQPVRIIATPSETIMPKDWTEISVSVQRTGRKRTAHIDLMAMIKEGKTVLQIGDVAHWPSEFTPGDRVVTSFSVSNKGTIVARDVTVFFYLNGKQKNKVMVTIPAGAVADVQIPWIALKGKNKVRIRLKEQ